MPGQLTASILNEIRNRIKLLRHVDRFSRNIEDEYEIGPILGRGSFGIVRIVTHKQSQHKMAMKIIKKQMLSNTQRNNSRPYRIEEMVLKTLHSQKPNSRYFTQLYDVFETATHLYFILELCSMSLYDYLIQHNGSLHEDQVRVIAYQVCEATAYLHKLGIIHRDLKLENILLTSSRELQIKLIDFGSSQFINSQMLSDSLTLTSQSTLYTSSPQLLKLEEGANHHVVASFSDDNWSLGVIFSILLTGESPFCEQNISMMLKDIRTGTLRWTDTTWHGISETAKDFIKRFLEMDPNSRMTCEQALQHPFLTLH